MATFVPIVPNATTADEDQAEYRNQHVAIFGHLPIPNVATGQRCCHPLHNALQRLLDAPGVQATVDFDTNEVISVDDLRAVTYRRGYDRRVDHFRDRFAGWQEEDDWYERKERGE